MLSVEEGSGSEMGGNSFVGGGQEETKQKTGWRTGPWSGKKWVPQMMDGWMDGREEGRKKESVTEQTRRWYMRYLEVGSCRRIVLKKIPFTTTKSWLPKVRYSTYDNAASTRRPLIDIALHGKGVRLDAAILLFIGT